MNTNNSAAWGAFVLRVASGVLFVLHGLYLKVFIFTMAGTVGFFESIGYPGFMAWVTVAIETLGGLALIVGFKVRWVSLPLIGVLLGAALHHFPNGWLFDSPNGGYEFPIFWAVIQAAIALIGPGAFALGEKKAQAA